MLLNARCFSPDGRCESILRAVEDITDRKRTERVLKEAERQKNEVSAQLAIAHHRMSRDLKAAAKIQETFLPCVPGAAFGWIYRPPPRPGALPCRVRPGDPGKPRVPDRSGGGRLRGAVRPTGARGQAVPQLRRRYRDDGPRPCDVRRCPAPGGDRPRVPCRCSRASPPWWARSSGGAAPRVLKTTSPSWRSKYLSSALHVRNSENAVAIHARKRTIEIERMACVSEWAHPGKT